MRLRLIANDGEVFLDLDNPEEWERSDLLCEVEKALDRAVEHECPGRRSPRKPITGRCATGDGEFSIDFDARRWFEDADDVQLFNYLDGGEDDVDIIEDLAPADPALAELVGWLKANPGAQVKCMISTEDVEAYVRDLRPTVQDFLDNR